MGKWSTVETCTVGHVKVDLCSVSAILCDLTVGTFKQLPRHRRQNRGEVRGVGRSSHFLFIALNRPLYLCISLFVL